MKDGESQLNALVEFHDAFSLPVCDGHLDDWNLRHLRMDLIHEEAYELEKAQGRAEVLKELADLLYVVLGYAVTFGLPINEAFNRVHQSNMTKLGPDGKPVYREDGKVLKGPNYQAPSMKGL